MSAPTTGFPDAAAWHDVECAAYDADLPLWHELAQDAGGPVMELGCGTGRVALALAADGHEVTGVDADAALVEAMLARARSRDLAVRGHALDARSLALGPARFALVLAPMQVAQLLEGEAGRAAMLESVRAHLHPGGLLAIALADPWEGAAPETTSPPVPDMREQDGWLLSSRPVGVRPESPDRVALDRLREAVAPDGEHSESLDSIVIELFAPESLEAQARERGYRVRPARRVPETDGYVGSNVVLLEAA